MADGGVEHRLDASDVERSGQPAGLCLAHRVARSSCSGSIAANSRAAGVPASVAIASSSPKRSSMRTESVETGSDVTTLLEGCVNDTAVLSPTARLPTEQPASTATSEPAANIAPSQAAD